MGQLKLLHALQHVVPWVYLYVSACPKAFVWTNVSGLVLHSMSVWALGHYSYASFPDLHDVASEAMISVFSVRRIGSRICESISKSFSMNICMQFLQKLTSVVKLVYAFGSRVLCR